MRNTSSAAKAKKNRAANDPVILPIPAKWAKSIGRGKMLIPSRSLVIAAVNKIPWGRLATIQVLRDYLAQLYQVKTTCPFTTGIMLYLTAHEAERRSNTGNPDWLPYWRVLKQDGSLNAKFPGGLKKQAAYLEREGFTIIKGKKPHLLYVEDAARKWMTLNELLVYELPVDMTAYIEDSEY